MSDTRLRDEQMPNRVTDDQIKVLRRMLKEIDTLEAGDRFERFVLSRRKDALTAALDYVTDTRDMLEAFQMGTFNYGGQVWVITPAAGGFQVGDGSNGDDRRFDSALAAWREGVKGEKV